MDVARLIEDELNKLSADVAESGSSMDELKLGKMTFYMALRRVISGSETPEDTGMMDAINDTLQKLGYVDNNETFLKARGS